MNHNIQSLRALAALAVMLFHAVSFFERCGGELGVLRGVLLSGHVGVDLFFVISGFIIARSGGDTTMAPRHGLRFAERRLLRIYLGYWPVLALALGYYHFSDNARLAQVDLPASIFLLSHHIGELVIGQSWSLSFELFYYLVFALLALFPPQRTRPVLILCLSGVGLANLVEPLLGAHFLLSPHLLELFGGMLLGQARLNRGWRQGLGVLSGAAGVLVLAWFSFDRSHPMVTAVLFGSAAVLLVWIADLAAGLGHNRPSWLSALGDASYGLYLLHYLLFEVFVEQLAPLLPERSALPFFFGIWFLVSIGLALAHYRYLERPLYRWACRKRGLSPPSVPT